MQGEFNFNKFVGFLKSFWGLLTSIAVLLPSLIYFLKTKQISESVISEYYLSIPTTFSILMIPFLFLFEDKLSNLSFVRKTSLIFFVISIITSFAFIFVKSDIIYEKASESYEAMGGVKTRISERSDGSIMQKKTRLNVNNEEDLIEGTVRINRFEFLCLILFTISIIFLTSSFASLGIFYYSKHYS